MRSVRFKITAITIAAIFTSMLSVFCACFFTIASENDRNSAEKMNLLCRNLNESLEEYFLSVQQTVTMSSNLAMDSMDGLRLLDCGVAIGKGTSLKDKRQTRQQAQDLSLYMAEYCSRIQEVFGSVASRTHGVVSYYYCLNPEISPQEHGFYYYKAGKTGFDAQEPLDVSRTDPENPDGNMWYYTAVKRGRPSWIAPYRESRQGNMLTFSYVTPIYKAGLLIGVLGMDIPFDIIKDQVSSIHLYKTGYAVLLDKSGRVLYHPDQETGEEPWIFGMPVYEKILSKKDSGDTLLRYEIDGEEKQLSFTTLSNGMKLVVVTPVKEVMETWNRLIRIILLFTVILTLIFVFIMMVSMGIIIRPLQQLTVASRKLADGDYDVELAYRGQDEVGLLTGAFTQMRDHLKYYISDLNRRIYTDDLTGLPNKLYFNQLAEAARLSLLEEDKQAVILYINPIGIGHFNRQYGYESGDRLLCEIAEILVDCFGKDRVCYMGMARFAAVAKEDGIGETLQRFFIKCLNEEEGKSVPVRVGIYPYRLEYVDVNIACDRARNACDLNRGTYLCTYAFFDRGMIEKNENYRYIINNLDRALKEGWIKAFYQPIISSATGKVCDEEALARWIDPVKGFLSPADFIPILESSRQIYKVDLYVLDQILLKLKKQEEMGLCTVPQSLNLSRVDFDECDIVKEVQERVDRAGISHDKLTIEITESIVGSDFDFIKEQVMEFRRLGFAVWMDDFGSGYSSLDVLQDIHFDLIKFDMHFLHHFEEGDESRTILTHLTRMAHELGLQTLTEGVETREQAAFLKEIGCSRLQGYYFSKPVPFEEDDQG